jgi:hypothetical protein
LPRLPGNSHRVSIIGRTGTGKTQAGLWHLSLKHFSKFPWVMFDAKGDTLINEIAQIPGVKAISMKDTPDKSGLHILRATPPQMKSDAMDDFLWRIHKRGRCGLFCDEGYVFDPRGDAFNTVLTQGRSLQIPMIVLSQRPRWLSQFVFSEADFFQVFALNHVKDRRTCEEFIPADLDNRLPDYHSLWYDVGRNSVHTFSPVPPRESILENFENRLRIRKRVI